LKARIHKIRAFLLWPALNEPFRITKMSFTLDAPGAAQQQPKSNHGCTPMDQEQQSRNQTESTKITKAPKKTQTMEETESRD